MRYFYYTLFSLIVFVCRANQSPTLFRQLQSINACWGEQKDIKALPIYQSQGTTYSDKQLIQLHLQLVENTLRKRSTGGLSEAQKTARLNNLNNLHAYWQTNTYPINNKTMKRNPVFIDDYHTFCAVGYLMKTSGHEKLARRIAATQNLSYLRDIRIQGLAQWVMASGLTLDELAWIQPGYLAPNYSRSLGKGVNGPVYALAGDAAGKKLFVAGNFTQADGSIACNNIVSVTYNENDIFTNTFSTMGDGLNGPVYTLFKDGNDLYAGGSFNHSGTTTVYNISKWDGEKWNALGQLNGTVYAICKYNNMLFAGGDFAFMYNCQTFVNIAYWNGTMWKPVCNAINGIVKALTVYDNKIIAGGTFTAVKSGVDSFTTNHLLAFDGQTISTIGNGVSANVRSLESASGKLYAGGDLKQHETDTNYFGIKWYDHFWGWQGDYLNQIYHYGIGGSITNVNSISNHYIAGKLSGGAMYRSVNTGYYDEYDDLSLKPFASTNGEVFAILSLGKRVFHGGSFSAVYSGLSTGGSWSYPAGNIAVWDPDYVGINTVQPGTNRFTLYPNPTISNTTIESCNMIRKIHVYDCSGKLVWENAQEKGFTEYTLERNVFPSDGLYLITLETTDGIIQHQKLLVE